MNETTNTQSAAPAAGYRPRLSYYHASPKGSGSAINFELHPAHWSAEGNIEGSLFVSMANQKTVGVRNGSETVFPSFDWKNRLVLRLTMTDIAQIVMVFRGMQESVGEGRGIFHRSARYNTVIKFEHRIDPHPCYALEVYRKSLDGAEQQRSFIAFSPAEAVGLSLAIEQSMSLLAFGIPEVRERAAQAPSDAPARIRMAAGAESLSEMGEDPF